MIKAKVIPRLLEQLHTEGIESSMLVRDDGCVLGSAGLMAQSKNKEAHVVAAILSNVWADYQNTGSRIEAGPLKVLLINCEQGKIGSIRIGGQYIAAVCGKNVKREHLKSSLIRLHESFSPIIKSFGEQ